jgi:signal transduction histidine kinase
MPVGVVLVNEEKRLEFQNNDMRDTALRAEGPNNSQRPLNNAPGFLQIDPSTPDESIGLDWITDPGGTGCTLRQALQRTDENENQERDYRMVCRENGRVYDVKTKYLPLFAHKRYKIAVVKDQTAYEGLMKNQVLERCQRMLLASILHDVRNPLHAIEGYRACIDDAQDVQQAKQANQHVGSAVRQIDCIVSGACDLLLGNAKDLLVRVEPFELRPAVEQAIGIIRPALEAKQLELQIHIGATVPDFISSDPKRYVLILYYLLRNATKFTEQGDIKVNIDFNPGTEMLVTSVADTGVGIPEEKLESLFKMYADVDSANTYNPQGMGFGLSLCKRLSLLLGGDIRVVSAIGRGTTFTFDIRQIPRDEAGPLPSPHTAGAGHDAQPHTPIKVQTKRAEESKLPLRDTLSSVLIVDDDPINRHVLMSYLSGLGITADQAENGHVALELVDTRTKCKASPRYNLILMDINMPVMDGTTATARLRGLFAEHPALQTPIVAVTAAMLQSKGDLQDLLAVGFSDIRKTGR